ncbi:MAG: preprotein translocase subunit SecG [Clostridia bacterium]|nr:preprotein translocase subunit SecG [Clostridia bacterium]MCI9274543.1 preprotein translocase subunit SecG [Clostridia bacterium]
MEIIKNILLVIYVIVTFVLIVLTLIQTKDESGASSTITGSSTNNFYNQNKGRTKEGRMKKWTIILGVAFAVLAVALSIFYI